jgi:hypothetical protein
MSERQIKVFISYRREDCMVHAGRLADNLKWQAAAQVSLDVDIPPGASFPEWIDREIAACDVVLVVIGDEWLTIAGPEGRPRIEDPADWVHVEIQAALERGVLTIPVLVEGTVMPDRMSCPTSSPGWRIAMPSYCTTRLGRRISNASPQRSTAMPPRRRAPVLRRRLVGLHASQTPGLRPTSRGWTLASSTLCASSFTSGPGQTPKSPNAS